MRFVRCSKRSSKRKIQGFTLVEVVISAGLAALTFTGIIYGYAVTSDRAEWSACSLAAQSLAVQAVEQARAAKWDPQAWPPIDELGITNFSQVFPLDLPVAKGNVRYATNYVTVSMASANPPIRELRSECAWRMLNGSRTRGLFTNSVSTLRAPDQ